MKKLTVLAVFALAMMLGFSSCTEADLPTDGTTNLFDAPAFLAPAPDNSVADLTGGTLDQPFALVSEEADIRMCDGTGRENPPGMGNKREFMPMARILRNLKLDEVQIELVKDIMANYRLCVKENVQSLRLAEKELLAPFNEQRRNIMMEFKNGLISREEAAAQLKLLNEQVRELLANQDFRVQACIAMKECRRLMFEQIGATLTTQEQMDMWNRWVASQPDVPCERKTPPTRER
jgi:hypothetical protein